MSWFIEDKRTWLQKLVGNIIKTGNLPKHVAIIMDGNRRYARINHLKQIQGHISGFDKLGEVGDVSVNREIMLNKFKSLQALNWCFTMDIKEVTVYAFSIENFKRSKDEVEQLFNLAREKFQKLFEEK